MEKIKIYLDEDVRPLLAEVLRKRGYDVVSWVEKELLGLSDEEQLKAAIEDKRAILTHNVKDFVQLLLATTFKENLKSELIWLSDYKNKK